MRILTPALLALTPALLHAQASSPAQPRNAAPVLTASLSAPAELKAAAAAAGSPGRVTNLVAPKLIKKVTVDAPEHNWDSTRFERTVTVSFTVDKTGVPTDLKVVSPTERTFSDRVLKAVSQFRYTPGTLNSVPMPFEVTLNVLVEPAE